MRLRLPFPAPATGRLNRWRFCTEGDDAAVNVLEAIAVRQSVREYKPDPVPESILMKLIEAAHQAPSSWNLQPWEFIVVTDPELKKKLRVAANNQAHVEQAGATIVCLGSMRQQDALADRLEKTFLGPDTTPERRERVMRTVTRMREDQEYRRLHVLTNTYIAIAFLVLAAQEYGLGTVWMGGFNEPEVKELLGIPDDYVVASLVSVGYPADSVRPQPRKRRPLDEIYSFNGFRGASMPATNRA